MPTSFKKHDASSVPWRFLDEREIAHHPDGFATPWCSGFIVHYVTPRARWVFEQLTGEASTKPFFVDQAYADDFFLAAEEMSLWVKIL